MATVHRSLDILVCRLEKMNKRSGKLLPQVLQGQGNLDEPGNVSVSDIAWHFPFIFDLSLTDQKWALMTICTYFRAYFRSLKVHFPNLVFSGNIDLSAGRYVSNGSELIRLLKDLGCSPLEYICNQKSDLLLPVYGSPFRYLRQALKRGGNRSINYANDCLQFKNSCPKVPDWFVREAELKHKAKMIAPCRHPLIFQERVIESARQILGLCDGLQFFSLEVDREVLDLSTSSTIEMNRDGLGAYGHYMNFDGNYHENGSFRPYVRHYDSNPNGSCTYRQHMWPTEGELLSDLLNLEGVQRKVVSLTEPLKVRAITVQHACESTLWGRWQKEVSRKLCKLPQMTSGKSKSHNGRQSDFDDHDFDRIEHVMENYRRYGWRPVIISDDASAATDSISPALSAKIADLTWQESGIGRTAFYSTWTGTVHYSDKTSVDQVNGQLMGDRRSFPTLSIIHMAAKRAFLSRQGLLCMPSFFRVNGDDGVIILPDHLVESYFDWMENLWSINRVKTYVHTNLFSFNSKLWKIRTRSLVPLMRFKLIDGIDKNGNSSTDPRLWNRVSLDAPFYGRTQAWTWFCAEPKWNKVLKSATNHGANWFLPEVAGGLGLTRVGPDWYITPKQKTSIVKAAAGDPSRRLKIVTKRQYSHLGKPLRFTLPVCLGKPNEQEEPVVKRIKLPQGPALIRYPRPERVATWRDVNEELSLLEKATTHFCIGWDCPYCFDKDRESIVPGVSIVYCESYLPNSDVQKDHH